MKKVSILFLPLILIGCNNYSNLDIVTKCPFGAPSILYYTEGDNANFETVDPTQIVSQFQAKADDACDCLIIDSYNGLKQAKAHQESEFKLAKLLTTGNLYLVGLNDNNDAPKEGDVIVAFQENAVPGLVFKEILIKNFKFNVSIDKKISNVSYVDDVSKIGPIAKTGMYNGGPVDYVLIAEPLLYTVSHNEGNRISEYIRSVRDLFKEDTGIEQIPQAALFVNAKKYALKKEQFNKYFLDLDSRINDSINNLNIIKETLNKYGDIEKQTSRFGFNSNVVLNVQEYNGLAINDSKERFTATEMNKFINALSLDTPFEVGDNLFLNINE